MLSLHPGGFRWRGAPPPPTRFVGGQALQTIPIPHWRKDFWTTNNRNAAKTSTTEEDEDFQRSASNSVKQQILFRLLRLFLWFNSPGGGNDLAVIFDADGRTGNF